MSEALSEVPSNTMRRPSIPFSAMGVSRARQNPQVSQGCPCCGAEMSAARPFVDRNSLSVIYKNRARAITPQEFSILELLTLRYPAVLSQDSIITHVWPVREPECAEWTIKATICRLRKKILPMGLQVVNVFGVGYRLVVTSADRATVGGEK